MMASENQLLSQELRADEIVVDELTARKEAARHHLSFIGPLGILPGCTLDLIDLPSTFARVQQTTFYVGSDLIRSVLDEDAQGRNQ